MSKGALYIASGEKYINAAERSAQTLKNHNPSLPVTIYTDDSISPDVFDNHVQLDEPINSMGDSILSEEYFPYDRNLYIDVDTCICGNLDDIFKLLDSFDIAASYGLRPQSVEEDVPNSFPELNTGVLVYRDEASVHELFDSWQQEYQEDAAQGLSANQPSFRRALYHSNVNHTVLPESYNCRTLYSGFLRGEAKIVHGWHKQPIEDVAAKINRTSNPRVFVAMRDTVEIFSPSDASIKDWVLFTMATSGILSGLVTSFRHGISLFKKD